MMPTIVMSTSTVTRSFDALLRLGIEPAHFPNLAVQGFLSTEDRGGKRPIVKLRYRVGGRQVVKYVGTDPKVIRSVRDDLRRLQHDHRQDRDLRRLARVARALLRHAKRQLGPLLAAHGWTFHGYAIRKSEVWKV